MQQLNASNSSSGSLSPSATPQFVATGAVLGLCCVLGVPGNVAVLVVLGRRLKEGSFTLWMMMSLAVSDLLSLLTLPLWVSDYINGWIFSTALCKFLAYVVYWSLYASVLSVTLLSVQRYLQVLYPQRWARLGERGQRALLGGVWVLAGVLGTPPLVQRRLVMKDGLYHCRSHYSDDGERVATLLLRTILGFIVPVSIMVSYYVCLHKRVNQMPFFSSQRMTRLVSSIIVCFLIFWIPLHTNSVLIIAAVWLKSDGLLRFSEASYDVAAALSIINSCVNPFLYAFSTRALHPKTPASAQLETR